MRDVDRLFEIYGQLSLAWPRRLNAATPPRESERDLFRGSLLWGAVGDAMGRPYEGWDASTIAERIGPMGPRSYQKWRGWVEGPIGTITDDTQLTIVVAETLLASGGTFDGAEFTRRLTAWLPGGRGMGGATSRAVHRLTEGVPWTESASERAAGNGAAMRAGPIGLVHALDATPSHLVVDAVLFSVPTHGHPVGLAAATVLAVGVGYLVRCRALGVTSLDHGEFIELLATVADELAPERVTERRPSKREITLGERVRQAADIETDSATLFDDFWSGAFVVESLPCAINAFLRSPDDPLRTLRTAISAGHDVDTIASMAGNLAGAWMGAEALRSAEDPWWAELEYRDRLIELADGLFAIATARSGGSAVRAAQPGSATAGPPFGQRADPRHSDPVTDDGLTPIIKVVYSASSSEPGIVADEETWPYTPESLERIERWTGIAAADASAALEAGREITGSMWTFRMAYQVDMPDPWVMPHTACPCRVCVFVMAKDHLPERHWDCHDFPRAGSPAGEFECSDPHGVGCECAGTQAPGTPCEACQLALDGPFEWEAAATEGPSEFALWVMFTEGDARPESVVDERAWPYTTSSFQKVERITGIPADRVGEVLDGGAMICTRLMWIRRVPMTLAQDPAAVHSLPVPRVVSSAQVAETAVLREPCECALCIIVATHGWLEEGHLDCHNYPANGGSGPCSDPFAIGCRCPGTEAQSGQCEACGAYDDPAQVASIASQFAASRARRSQEAGRDSA